MPTPAENEMIDGFQSALAIMGMTAQPGPVGPAITGYNATIDIVQGTDGTWRGTVSTGAGVLAGLVTSATLEGITLAAATIAFATSPVGSLMVFYEGSVATMHITQGVMTATQRAALDGLNTYFPIELSASQLAVLNGLQQWSSYSSVNGWSTYSPQHLGYIYPGVNFYDDIYGNTLRSPIALDLDGDGLEYTALADSQVYFDGDNDQYVERTEWLKPDDGFLVRDVNGNGKIDNVTEMFGDDSGTSAYAKLKALDTNNDNKIDENDEAWSSLRIWQDANGNGRVDGDELKTLSSLDIRSLDTASTNETIWGGHAVAGTSTYTRNDGSTGNAADVLLNTDQVDSWYVGDDNPYQTLEDVQVFLLPLSRGYGNLPTLQYAMLQDANLKDLVTQFKQLGSTQLHEVYDRLEAIILKWAKAESITQSGKGFVDGRHLSVLEAVHDEKYFYYLDNTSIVPEFYGEDIGQMYAHFADEMMVKILVQGPLRPVFVHSYYDYSTDKIHMNDTIGDILTRAQQYQPTVTTDNVVYWNEIARIITNEHSDFNLSEAQAKALVDNTAGFLTYKIDIVGTSGNDYLYASGPGADYFQGTSDIFYGGAGNDFIGMGQGDDVALFDGNSGQDTVLDGLGYDAIILQNATSAQTQLSVSGENLIINIPGLHETITVQKQFETASFGRTNDHNIEEIQFADGVIWNREILEAVARGGAIPTVLTGNNDDNTLVVGANIFNVRGGDGADIFKISADAGNFVTITDFNVAQGDRIDLGAFTNITSLTDLNIRDVGGHATFTLQGPEGPITVNLSGISSGQLLEQFFLNNWTNDAGTTLVGGNVSDSLTGTIGRDTIYGNEGNDNLRGEMGNDLIYGWTDNDTLSGGHGNDTLSGDDGNDNLMGDAGNDVLYGGAGADAARGGDGNDYINGDAGNDSLYGQIGNDTISGGDGADVIQGNDGQDALYGGEMNDTISGGDGNDSIYGENANDRLLGDLGDDILLGGAGNDILDGGDGNDVLEGGAGSDKIIGGTGTDAASYSASTVAVNVNLNLTTAQTGGDAAGDILSGIENITGSRYSDQLTGDANANLIAGGAGADTIDGGAGNDTVIGGRGEDRLTGGTGSDTVSYLNSTAAVRVNLALATAQAGGDAAGDILRSFEHVTGSAYHDMLTGNAAANRLTGGAGNDTLWGGAGNDLLIGGTGADHMDGGDGIDTVSYAQSAKGVVLNLASTSAQSSGEAAGDILSNIESAIGSVFNDTIAGSAVANRLDGSYGIDTVSYVNSTAAVSVNLSSTTAQSGGFAQGDTLIGFENLIGSAYHDTLTGSNTANIIIAGAGNDRINGGNGDDTINGGAGADNINGGNHSDTVTYATSNAAVNVDLTRTGVQFGGDAAGDVLVSIENIIGSKYADTLAGNAAANHISGGGGVDTVSYAASNRAVNVNLALATAQSGGFAQGDILNSIENVIGSNFNDTLTGDTGANRIDGGAGIDTVFYTRSESAVRVNLNSTSAQSGGEARGDILLNIENIVATRFNDVLYGNTAANTLDGSAGNDLIRGGDGNDTLLGGSGSDTLLGGNGIDTASYIHSTGAVGIDLNSTGIQQGGDALGDVLQSIENIVGSNFNDTIISAVGANDLNGGIGNDVISYAVSTAGVTVNLSQSLQSGGYAAGDHLRNFEHIIGSAYNDRLTGNIAANSITGGNGNDILDGGNGNDILDGGDGNDTLFGSNGGDNLDGDNGIDTINYRNSNAGINVDLGTNSFAGGWAQGDRASSIENIVGSTFSDTISGNTDNNNLNGSDGDDYIYSSHGADTMNGGEGIYDVVSYQNSNDGVNLNLTTNVNTGGHASGDLLSNFEYYYGSNFVDTIIGSTRSEYLRTFDGNDSINGDGGDDRLDGGLGADTINGGAGNDTADYYYSTAAVNVDLDANAAQAGGWATGDILIDIENIVGSTYNDTISGNSQNNRLNGHIGNDVILGGDGNDTLEGNVGNDTLYGDMGSDSLIGGDGIDTAVYQYSSAAVNINLVSGLGSGGFATGDHLGGIENVFGSTFNDTMTGDGGNNAFWGLDGNDVINGGAGADIIEGGNGNDTLTGGTGSDMFVFANSFGADRVTDFEGEGLAGGDQIYIRTNTGYNDFASLSSHISYNFTASTATINLGNGNIITVGNVTQVFNSGDFVFGS